MSNLSTFTEIGLVDARASAGVLIVPSSSDIPGRVITYKDIYGAVGNSTIALLTSTGDTYEDGTNYRTLTTAYDFITLYAGSTTKWYTIGGTQFNGFRTNILSNNAFTTSSITTNTLTSAFNYTNFLYPQLGLTSINTAPLITSNLLPINTTAITIGNITTNYVQAFFTSTITSNIIVSINPQSTINVGNSLIPAYSTNRISTISLGNPTNRWFQIYAVSTITSSINADIAFGTTLSYQNISTQNITGFNLLGTTILSTQAIYCSSLQIGPADAILDIIGPLRTQDMSTVTLQASTITAGTMTLDRLFNGPIITATTTQNLYPFNPGALVGFGSNTAQNGTYAEGHFRSTFTQIIQPTLDNDGFSNIVRINGTISSANMFISTMTANTITASTIFASTISTNITFTTYLFGPNGIICQNLYPTGVNVLGFGTGGTGNGPWDSASIRQTNTSSINTNYISSGNIFVSSIYTNAINASSLRVFGIVSTNNIQVSSITMNVGTGVLLSMSTVTTNALTIGSGSGFINIPFVQSVLTSSIQTNTSQLNSANITLSTINRKLYTYASTIGIPASTFTLSGTAANNITVPLVLYSNVAFPHAGFFNIIQSAIFSRTTATANVPQASIFYTPGIYPSTIGNVDGYVNLPYLGNANASTFTSLAETLYISTTQLTRNIIYSDSTGNAYTANLFMSPITLQYIPNNTLNPE